MNRVMISRPLRRLRNWFATRLHRWSAALKVDPDPDAPPPPRPLSPPTKEAFQQEDSGERPSSPDALCPALREPLSMEEAVLGREMTVLRREAADALAALGAAHALVASARLAQLQQLRPRVGNGEASGQALMALAADYQAWQNDQVRLFDAMALVLRMKVPEGPVLAQMDQAMHEQARNHLQALSLEYQRRLLMQQFPPPRR